jgi:hypothetical protein
LRREKTVVAIPDRRICFRARNFHSTAWHNHDDLAGEARDAAGLC